MSPGGSQPGYVLRTEQRFRESRDVLFSFFAAPANLGRITPPWLGFRIVPPPPTRIQQGSRISYRIHLHHLPMRWLTEITVWQPPERFVDTQLKGPYRVWRHEHRLDVEDGMTVMRDTVKFLSRGPGLAVRAIHRHFVNPKVHAIFTYRQQQLAKRFDSISASPVTIEQADLKG